MIKSIIDKEIDNTIKNLYKLDVEQMLMIIRNNPFISGESHYKINELREYIEKITELVIEMTKKHSELMYNDLIEFYKK